jgi:hypothetical protein
VIADHEEKVAAAATTAIEGGESDESDDGART